LVFVAPIFPLNLNEVSRLVDFTGHWALDAGHWTLESGHWTLDTGNWEIKRCHANKKMRCHSQYGQSLRIQYQMALA